LVPWHHRDPFDRLLVAQATSERLALVSADSRLAAYGAQLVW
jgi:PIN domain nuclease of toxin-antitoxin system